MPLSRRSGFSLVELMVVIAIAAILLIVAIPSFKAIINSSRLTSAANELVAAVQTARADAIRYNRRTEVCLSNNANTATPTCAADNATDTKGWLVFIDVDKDGTYTSGTDTPLRVATVHPTVSILGSPNLSGTVKIIFRSDGMARGGSPTGSTYLSGSNGGTVQMCIATNKGENVRYVRLKGGSVDVARATVAGACVTPPN